ncbi:MAG: hypothetical protein IJY71_00445 [Clostridia bacterium]|nr:hypothetical protein [Clostridia bacterium]
MAAATVASYAFTLGSSPKLMAKMDKKHIEGLEQEIELLQRIKSANVEVAKIFKDIDGKITEDKNEIAKCKADITKKERSAFLWEVAGFLVFLCIIAFNGIFTLLSGIQEVCTILAFVLVLLMDYVEAIVTDLHEETLASKKETYHLLLSAWNETKAAKKLDT